MGMDHLGASRRTTPVLPRGARGASGWVLSAILAVVVLASSCASGSSGGTSASSSRPGSTSAGSQIARQAVDPAVAKLVPASVRGSQPISIATDANYPPNEFTAADGGLVGMDVDLGRALLQVMGLKGSFVNVPFDTIVPAVEKGTYAMGMASITDDSLRDHELDVVNYFSAGESFYVKAGTPPRFTDLASLCGAKVAVETGTVEEQHAIAQQASCTASGRPAMTIASFAEEGAVNEALLSGAVDVAYADTPVVDWKLAKQGRHGLIERSGASFDVAPYGIAVERGNGMAAAVKAALEHLMANGTYAKILGRWGLRSGAIAHVSIDVKHAAAG